MTIGQLASEDAFRLAVLLAGDVHAVRIDEGALTVHALTSRGEARVTLHPEGRAERYLMLVREVLAGHAMGSPGGYPVHLRRWTRSGHASPKKLEALLRLGEPEAVTAVSLSASLTDELARRAWWAQPCAEVARSMLGHEAVRRGAMGPILAQHVIEHLPYEEDPDLAIASVSAVAAAGLFDDAVRARLWRAAQNRPHYVIGWLEHEPHTLPPAAPREMPAAVVAAAAQGDPASALLVRFGTSQGQGVLRALALALDKPPTHDAVFRVLDVAASLFAPARAAGQGTLAEAAPELQAALGALAGTGRAAAEPILSRTTAVGPLMRRHLASVLQPLQMQLQALRGAA